MTSTAVGLPDRYRPLDQVGPDEVIPTGVIRTWRAKDRVLNRDVAIRVHTPGGAPAHAWIARALTAGGLATPALAMVYDAAEGTGDGDGPGSAAYVVNEWIDGETLPERLARGPLPEREARTVLRRLAEGVAEAHRVGLAVGGLTPENVVLRPNGLVGLRGVPAATGTVADDITALGALLEFCLTGRTGAGAGASIHQPDLAALVRRARSTEPGQGLTSAAAMAALLAQRPWAGARTTDPGRVIDAGRSARSAGGARDTDTRDRDTRDRDADRTVLADVPPAYREPAYPEPPPAPATTTHPGAYADDGEDVDDGVGIGGVAFAADDDEERYPGGYGRTGNRGGGYDDGAYEPYEEGAVTGSTDLEEPRARRRLLVVGLPVLALAVVIGIAVWLGSSVLSVAGSVDNRSGSTPPPTTAQSTTHTSTSARQPAPGPVAAIAGARVFDPYGDGNPENDRQVPRSYDGDPSTTWSTLQYRGSAHFGNLKPGVGVLYDLGSAQKLGGVKLTTTLPGASVEIRSGNQADGSLSSYTLAGTSTLQPTTQITFKKPVTARYVLVWITDLVPSDGGYAANLAEVAFQTAR